MQAAGKNQPLFVLRGKRLPSLYGQIFVSQRSCIITRHRCLFPVKWCCVAVAYVQHGLQWRTEAAVKCPWDCEG